LRNLLSLPGTVPGDWCRICQLPVSTPAQVGTNCWVARYGDDANNAAATPVGNDPAKPERGSLHPERLQLEGQRRRDLRLRADFNGSLPRTTSNAMDDRARYLGIHSSKWTGRVLGPWKSTLHLG
jgi:hypothetical protein